MRSKVYATVRCPSACPSHSAATTSSTYAVISATVLLFTISNSSLLFVYIAVTGFPFTRRLSAEKGTSSFRDFELWPITLTPELEGSDELPRQISKLKVILFKSYWLHEHTDTHWQTQQTDCAIGTAKWSVTYKSQSSLLSNTTANVCFAYRRLVRCRTFAFTERKTTNELINAGVFWFIIVSPTRRLSAAAAERRQIGPRDRSFPSSDICHQLPFTVRLQGYCSVLPLKFITVIVRNYWG